MTNSATSGRSFRRRAVTWRTLLAGAVCLVLLGAGCTSSDDGGADIPTTTSIESTTSTTVPSGSPTEAINAALGGTKAVQDFAIHLDLERASGDDWISFYDALRQRAREEIGAPIELTGGLVLDPVTTLQGAMTDATGAELPSLSVDFGLIHPDTEAMMEIRSTLLDEARDETLRDALASLDVDEPGLLVEIVTADYARQRLHVTPGDRSNVDVTFVDEVEVGDTIRSIHLFGETFPGDPAEEQGLDPLALFAYRWQRGLFALAGDADGRSVILDDTVTVVEGSKIMTREAKRGLLNLETFAAVTGAISLEEEMFGEMLAPLPKGVYMRLNGETNRVGDDMTSLLDVDPSTGALILVVDDRGFRGCYLPCGAGLVGPTEFATVHAVEHCVAVATRLNQYNKAHGAIWEWTEDFDEYTVKAAPKPESEHPLFSPPSPVFCGAEPPEPWRPEGVPFRAFIGGDVHIRMLDGRFYDHQGTGEFLMYTDDATTVQARLEPWAESDRVSITTAVAVQVDGFSVSMHAGGSAWIDGEPAMLPRGEAVTIGGAQLLRWSQGWVVVGGDGTIVRVLDSDVLLLLSVTPASTTQSRGMFGGGNGDPTDDFVTRDGRQLSSDADADFESFYAPGGFVDSWRISQDESLFHYEPGESASGFVTEGFPAAPPSLDALAPSDVSRAESLCAASGVTNPDALEDCVFDVAVTGDTRFIYHAFAAQEALPSDPDAASPDPVVRPSVAGGSIVAFGNVIIEFGADPPIQDPGGGRPRWQCTADEGSFFATSSFSETPTRMLEIAIEYLAGSRNDTGEDRFSVMIKLNSEDYAWALSYDDRFAGLTFELDGSILRASGSGFLNDPLDTRLHPIVVLPDDATLTSFALEATCGP